MNFVKNIKIIKTKVSYSSKDQCKKYYIEHGEYIIECPKCKHYPHVTYSYNEKEGLDLKEKYCPYCGKKLVEE